MAELPSQKQIWDAYGHAMGAAAGMELVLRIALLDAARKANPDLAEARQTALRSILRMTLRNTVERFMAIYPDFAEHDVFPEAINNAVDFRNNLAHHFLEGKLAGLRTEVGVQLIALECMEYTEHFRQIEAFVRERCKADFAGFLEQGVNEADQWVRDHPLGPKLADIKAGRLVR